MSPRPFLGLASLILVAGAILLHFFVLLAGAVNGRPVSSIYFLQVDGLSPAIPNAPNPARWTYWNSDSVDASGNTIINGVHPAWPFDPATNFGTLTGVPMEFQGTHYYYYMTRFMFAFNLIALFFMVVALFSGLLALCSRIGSYISSTMTLVGLVFEILTTVLMTVAYVKGRNVFMAAGFTAELGRYAFGFMWAATACLIIATVLFCVGGAAGKSEYSGGRGFGRKRSTRSRGSFIDTDSQRPVVEV